ncbi:hypothetical protein Ahy_A06g028872 [Arachis hypogaea]|uniref:GRF-type domain-containing protein n=1 Tax=Arachis hypogaea TaxID=3818 RepID=A0A445CRV3_ARAHY|nr:hypothetical protein Ahy_A06g028872 [Arachis hypogaea]
MASLVLLLSSFVSPKIKIHALNVASDTIEDDASSLNGWAKQIQRDGCHNELEEELMAEKILQEPRRRSGGVGREEQFAEGSGPKGKDGKDGVSPKCFYGEHAILFMSKTSNNLNRLFFGCLFYKVRQPHCKFFLWLDEHIAKFGLSDSRDRGEKEFGDGEEHQWKQDMENTINFLEKRIVALELKKTQQGGVYV